MDEADTFYQHLDSERLLKDHGPSLVADACEILALDRTARVAGMITMPDSQDATSIREMLTKLSGQVPPAGLLVGVVPRAMVEALLVARVGNHPWMEQGWQRQKILPIVVSTRDGFRFGFFPLDQQGQSAEQ